MAESHETPSSISRLAHLANAPLVGHLYRSPDSRSFVLFASDWSHESSEIPESYVPEALASETTWSNNPEKC